MLQPAKTSTDNQILNFTAFSQQALLTENVLDEGTQYPMRKYVAVLNLAETSGRVIDLVKRELYYSKQGVGGVRLYKGLNPVSMSDMLDDLKSQIAVIEAEMLIASNLASLPNADGTPGFAVCGSEVGPIPPNTRLAHGIIGKFGEAGELVQAWLESIISKKPVDLVNLGEELGDSGWYDAIIASAANINVPAAYWKVIDKLKARYPGKFTTEKAFDRNLEAERKILDNAEIETSA